jgi:apolipoprotein N-acyltransferase
MSGWYMGDRVKRILMYCGAILSGVLLMLAFPLFERSELAWIALVPLWIACRHASPKRAVFLGWLCGVVFFAGSVHWLTNVSLLGCVGLVMYCSLYFMPFGAVVSWASHRFGTERWYSNLLIMLMATATFVGFEYLRGVLFTGFAWNPLAVSQYRNLAVAQMAAWGGVAAVSALVVWMNAAISVTVIHYVEHRRGLICRPHFELMAGFMLLALAMALGLRTLNAGQESAGDPFTVALIQPAIPNLLGEWTEEQTETQTALIYERVGQLTKAAQAAAPLDLIIWSETVLPDFLRNSPRSNAFVRQFAEATPVLTGTMDYSFDPAGAVLYHNSSVLVGTNGVYLGKYDKQHLVIFGEYIPLHDQFPILTTMSPIKSSFTPGKGAARLVAAENVPPFSVLICFEDTVAPLARHAVNAGARWLVNQTNDAWFDEAEAMQHMAQCVFRAIENRVPVVRCANNGVTCAIDSFGRVSALLRDQEGAIGHPDFLIADVRPVTPMWTLYKNWGDWLGVTCAVFGLLSLWATRIKPCA